jgi:flagellar hook-basal body protein
MSISGVAGGLSASNQRMSGLSSNMAVSGVVAAKQIEVKNVASYTQTPYGPMGTGIKTLRIEDIARQGEIEASNTSTNIAISGDGMFAVKDTAGKIGLSRDGDYVIGADGDLVNQKTGAKLLAWRMDAQGRIPGEGGNEDQRANTLITSLDSINVKGLTGDAKMTTMLSASGRLNSQDPIFKGAGQKFSFAADDTYNGYLRDDDVIAHNGDAIRAGDKFTVSVAGGDEFTYEYGGVTNSFNIRNKAIFGRNKSTDTFMPSDNLIEGHRLRVTLGNGSTTDLKFTASTPDSSKFEFKDLTTLASALNRIEGISARVVSETLYIGATDGSTSIKFSDQDSTKFTSSIGLTDIDIASGTTKRFSTIGQLRSLISENNALSVTKDGRGISIHSKLPTDSVTFAVNAERENKINYVSATYQNDGGTDITKAAKSRTMKIHSSNSGVKAGDLVTLNLSIPGGVSSISNAVGATNLTKTYYVISSDFDGFEIAAPFDIRDFGDGNTRTIGITGDATWKKVTGSTSITYSGSPTATIADVATDLELNIGVGAFVAGASFDGSAIGDMVFVKDFGRVNGEEDTIKVPDGYYRITAVNAGAGTINIDIPTPAANADLAGGVGVGHNVKITRIGQGVGNFGIDTSTSFSNSLEPTRNSYVRIHMPNSKFGIGDKVAIGGTSIPGFDGISAAGDSKRYTVEYAGENWFEINVGTEAQRDILTALTGSSLPTTNYIDSFQDFSESVGFETRYDSSPMDPTYDPNSGSGKNLTNNIPGKFEQPLTVYDSQGIPHDLRLAFLKIGDNKWAVQLYAPKKADGTIEVDASYGDDGILSTAVINFDPSGNIIPGTMGDFENPIVINWSNGTEDQQLSINLGQLNDINQNDVDGSLRQLNGSNSFYISSNNGHAPGKFVGVYIEGATGMVYGMFDNGTEKAISQIPLVYVPNVNGLENIGNGQYSSTIKSGAPTILAVGSEGVGKIVPGALEKSTVDSVNNIMLLSQEGQVAALISAALSMLIEAQKSLVNRV